jgi:hypothetical protein
MSQKISGLVENADQMFSSGDPRPESTLDNHIQRRGSDPGILLYYYYYSAPRAVFD